MTDYLKLHPDDGDDAVTRGLRAIYAPPGDEGYWRDLEARILSRLTEATSWWDELSYWARPALVAAAVVLMAVSIALFRAQQVEQEVAYEAMLTPTPLPVETAVRPVLQGHREGTFRYLMTSR